MNKLTYMQLVFSPEFVSQERLFWQAQSQSIVDRTSVCVLKVASQQYTQSRSSYDSSSVESLRISFPSSVRVYSAHRSVPSLVGST